MVNDETRPSGHTGSRVRPAAKIGACDWCYEPCPTDELTVISGARLCQGCAPFYLGDEDNDEEEEEK